MLFFECRDDCRDDIRMINSKELKKRDLYLNRLIAFQDTEPVKVVTGIRRCGKSSLLKIMINHLMQHGILPEQILEMNFESFAFRNMTAADFYAYVKDRILPERRMYLFFDEVQLIPAWENAVNAFRVEFNCDIYVTGSNSYMLSSEYATYLAGRYVEIKMLPLSFTEFLDFQDFEIQETEIPLGGIRKLIFDRNGRQYQSRELFDVYMRYGGMPGICDSELSQEKALIILEGIYSTVVMRDILEREKRQGQKKITDPALLRKIITFLADSIGSSISATSIGNTLISSGLFKDTGSKGSPNARVPSAHTMQSYVRALLDAYLFYEIKRFDLKGKKYLRSLVKYYIADLGLRNCLVGFRDRDRGHALENVVYFELLRRGYDVAVGKADNAEIDFVAVRDGDRIYVQVTESMLGEDVRRRELAPLQGIRDNYAKIVLSLDPGLYNDYGGIKSLSLIDWLLGAVSPA